MHISNVIELLRLTIYLTILKKNVLCENELKKFVRKCLMW